MTAATREARTAATLLTIPQAAKRMGVSRSHVYNLIWAGELEFVNAAVKKTGKTKMRISEDAITAFDDARTKRHPRRRNRLAA